MVLLKEQRNLASDIYRPMWVRGVMSKVNSRIPSLCQSLKLVS